MGISNILESEWEDLDATLRDRRRSRDEFDISDHVEPMSSSNDRSGRRLITVQHRDTGAQRAYNPAQGSNWIADFVRDIDAGVF